MELDAATQQKRFYIEIESEVINRSYEKSRFNLYEILYELYLNEKETKYKG